MDQATQILIEIVKRFTDAKEDGQSITLCSCHGLGAQIVELVHKTNKEPTKPIDDDKCPTCKGSGVTYYYERRTTGSDMCSGCLAFNCDPMTMINPHFLKKIEKRRKHKLCPSCGHKPCTCKSNTLKRSISG